MLGFSGYAALLQQYILRGLGVQYCIFDAQILQGGAKGLLVGVSDWFQLLGTLLPVHRCVCSISFGE